MTDLFAEPEGATPLGPDDVVGLIPTWVATRADLNEVEERNIGQAQLWASRRTWTPDALLRVAALTDLHRRMLGDVWTWAGALRRRESNLGVDPSQIRPELHDLCDDVTVQAEDASGSAWSTDEIAVRFHHRLVSIHPFTNGNGRHARLATDVLLGAVDAAPFTWGRAHLATSSQPRREYLRALGAADNQDYEPLLRFVRS